MPCAQDLPQPKICPTPTTVKILIRLNFAVKGVSVSSRPFYTYASAIVPPAWQGSQPKATDNSSRAGLSLGANLGPVDC